MRTTPDVTLPLRVRRDSATPLPDQLAAALRDLVRAGVLVAGDRVPSTRALAAHFGLSRGTVVTAYDQLLAEGWLEAQGGRGTRVNPRVRAIRPAVATSAAATPRSQSKPAPMIDLRPGRPHERGLADATWRSAWRRAADEPLDVDVSVLGWDPLRDAVTDHLRRLRAVVRPPEQVAITAGGRDGLALVLAATGVRSVGVEEPGYPSLRRVLERAGIEVRPLATDAHGLITDLLPDRPPEMVIVTPSHQYPLGGSLPAPRRQALLDWAVGREVWIVEDDYDSELRYTSQPLPALIAMDDHARVILLGTFSKTLSPALATGFLVLPPALVPAAARTRTELGMPVSLVTQRAVGHYLADGGLTRHTQRMRRVYRRRRAEVVAALGGLGRGRAAVVVQPMDGGLHAVVECPGKETTLLDRLAQAGVLVSGLSDYWSGESDARTGIVFGFGSVGDAELASGLRTIATVLEGVT